MKSADLEYFNNGLFTRFLPNTAAGENAWRELAKEGGAAAVLTSHAKSVIAQLRKAGYSVAKAKPVKESLDDILKEVEA